jgi:predicted alpha/beta-fold hydrolase
VQVLIFGSNLECTRSTESQDELSPSVTLELTEHGEHVGFIYCIPFKEKYWYEKRLVESFEDKLGINELGLVSK